MEYICIKDYVAKSAPCNHTVRPGEAVILLGYMAGHPVIQLGTRHKSGYAHLTHVTTVVFEKFDDCFRKDK